MKIKNFRKKYIILSFALILTGVLISLAGFGVTRFNYNHLKENAADDVWYQTIHVNNNSLWYGVKLGDNIYLMTIGNAN